MLQSNVSVARWGQRLKTISKKMVNVDLDKVPQKNSCSNNSSRNRSTFYNATFEEI